MHFFVDETFILFEILPINFVASVPFLNMRILHWNVVGLQHSRISWLRSCDWEEINFTKYT